MKPKVLVVEDDKFIRDVFRLWLEEEVEILFATTLKEAEDLLDEHGPELAAAVLDACVESSEPDTMALARNIREQLGAGFLMIANSTRPDFAERVYTEGRCDFPCVKEDTPRVLLEELRKAKFL